MAEDESTIDPDSTQSPLGMPEDYNKSYAQKRRKTQEKKKIQILELHAKEVPVNLIAEAVQLSVTSVRGVLSKFEGVFKNLDKVDDYRKAKADILSASQLTVLESALSERKIDKASFLSLIQGAEIMNKMERLDLGKSTENHAHQVFGKINVGTVTDDEWIDAK